ncbi:MAG: histidine kinase dimerization/phospho-acceptor domain-containing protein [Candidatus Pelethousia sp.]|nr:histidine kinase dimerization/phospho-acceptor domain-containing protein [Candidatus Pelethousia sp.]
MKLVRNTILKKIVAVILLTVILSAALTALTFNYYGRSVFSRIKAKEMEPRAKYIADMTAEYLEGAIDGRGYTRAVSSDYYIWDAMVYVYNAGGELFAYPARQEAAANAEALTAYLPSVLGGERLYSPNTENNLGVIIGEPVRGRRGSVIGAVFLIKPLGEVRAAIGSLLVALIVSMVAVTAIMIAPAYLGSRSIVQPIRQMQAIANAMAGGDFTVRAPDMGGDEIASLGKSLNYLSAALSATIGDLTFEKNRLTATLNGLGEGIVSFDASAEVTQFNPASLRLLGVKQGQEPTGSPLLEKLLPAIKAVLAGEGTAQREMERGDAILRFTITSLYEGGRIEGAVMLIQDVTEAVRLEKTRTEYVANVSHELRTPLASIRGLADALNDGLVKKEEDKARYYGYILHESLRLSRLIDDLLELSRLQSGAVALSKQSLCMDELIYDVADRYSAAAQEKGLAITANVPENCLRANTNPDRTEQVLIALLDNAIKHTEGAGEIILTAQDQGSKLQISVSNPGEIGEKDLPHLFDRFYKVDQAHSGNGTGLGLSIAYEILSLLGESIWAESEDGRVTFTFTLEKA